MTEELQLWYVDESGDVAPLSPLQQMPTEMALEELLVKARNTKILRRVVKAVVTGGDPGDLTALLNPEAIEERKRVVGESRGSPRPDSTGGRSLTSDRSPEDVSLARSQEWATRLRRARVCGRGGGLGAGVGGPPRRHRHHDSLVVVDRLAVPSRGRGPAVDGEPERLVVADDDCW